MNDYALLVIGAGPGGYTAALRAAKLGIRTAVVESREAGGTCLNRGCVPTKTLLHASEAYRTAKESAAIGVYAENIRADLPEIFAYQRRVVTTLSQGVETLLKGAKVPLIKGRATILAPHTVRVTDAEGGESTVTADRILIATGSAPACPPIEGLNLPGVLTSDTLLLGADKLYRSIAIIGGGVIGVELATFYADLGSEVTVIEGLDRLLPTMDRELGQNLGLLFKKRNIRVYTSAMVRRVERTEAGLTVHFTQKDAETSVSAEVVLSAIGRRPYWDGLFADGLNPETDGRRLRVDERFRTSIEDVYAIGDVSSRVQLAHVAAAQGTACVELLAGVTPSVRLDLIPACIYCRPEIASVGMTEAEAKEKGVAVKVGKCVMGANARTLIADPGRSFMKLVAEAETGRLLGAVLMCPNATDMISEASEAIANGLTAFDLQKAMRPHPTFEEAFGDAVGDLCQKLSK